VNEVATTAPRQRGIAVQYEVSDIERMARAIASSKLFGITSPEQALALCLIAQAEGRHPASAAQDYHIVQNRPAKKADAMLRDFLAAGGKVEWHKLDDTTADATFSHPAGGSARITWNHDRAKQAGISNPMWKKYPRQMLRSRVVSEGVRTVFPMATSGMYVPEEVEDIPAANRVRDGSDGQPKSSRQAKIAGDWDIVKELAALPTEAALNEWLSSEHIAAITATFNATWRDQFDEAVAAKRAEFAKALEPTLSPEDSAKLREAMSQTLKRHDTQTQLKSWVRDPLTRKNIRSLTADDYSAFEDAYEARLNELPE
jgi:hypothetical protein